MEGCLVSPLATGDKVITFYNTGSKQARILGIYLTDIAKLKMYLGPVSQVKDYP